MRLRFGNSANYLNGSFVIFFSTIGIDKLKKV